MGVRPTGEGRSGHQVICDGRVGWGGVEERRERAADGLGRVVRYKNARASVADTLRVRGSAPKESQRSCGCRHNLRVVTADDQWLALKRNQGFCRLKTRDEVARAETTFGVPDPF